MIIYHFMCLSFSCSCDNVTLLPTAEPEGYEANPICAGRNGQTRIISTASQQICLIFTPFENHDTNSMNTTLIRQFHANRRWWRYFRSPFVVRSYDRGPSCNDPRCAPRKRIGVVIVIAWLRDGASLLDTHHTF